MSLKEKLEANELTIGSWITLAHSGIAELMTNSGAFDWLVIDMEHSVIELRDAQEMIQAIDLAGGTPLVRLTNNDINQIKRVLDAGAHGIVVPLVNSPSDAENAVRATYYAPTGARGTGLARAQGYGASFNEYVAWLKENGVVIVMIEHFKAVDALDEILAVPGVDGYIIGPYDLSASMNITGKFNHPRFKLITKKIKSVAKKYKISSGFHVIEPKIKTLKKYIKEGYQFLPYSTDTVLFNSAIEKSFKKIK